MRDIYFYQLGSKLWGPPRRSVNQQCGKYPVCLWVHVPDGWGDESSWEERDLNFPEEIKLFCQMGLIMKFKPWLHFSTYIKNNTRRRRRHCNERARYTTHHSK